MCCLGAPIALLWRFRELPEDLASYGPLPGLLSAAASLLFSCSVVAFSVLLRSLHCCLFVEIILPFAPSCVAGAVMDAHVQNDILLRDRTRNLVVVGRQPHPNPNHSSYSSVGRPRRGVTAAPLGVV